MAYVCSNCDHPTPGSRPDTCACGGRLAVVASAVDDFVGQNLDGRFEVIAPLGAGGMGVVYRGRQISIDREVAIKVMGRQLETDAQAVKRFLREAKMASALAHPNTVPIIDFGQTPQGRLYLVMELVRGRSLDAESASGPLGLPRVIAIGLQLCDALEAAHALAIVHRDLKLENVMLVDGMKDHVKILDFGLARPLADPTGVTGTNVFAGTPRYMPPEIAYAKAGPAPAQDMYAVGVILAELALGRPLWDTPSILALFEAKLAVDAAIADLPPRLRAIVRSLLAVEPGTRPNAATTRRLLEQLGDEPTPVTADEATIAVERSRPPPRELVDAARRGRKPTWQMMGGRMVRTDHPDNEHLLRGALRFAVHSVTASDYGLDARRDTASAVIVAWHEIIGIAVRRAPADYLDVLLVDVVTARTAIRILPWTRLYELFPRGDGEERARSIATELRGRVPTAGIDRATSAFLAGSAAPLLHDVAAVGRHDEDLLSGRLFAPRGGFGPYR